jgi:hypothetical protein
VLNGMAGRPVAWVGRPLLNLSRSV